MLSKRIISDLDQMYLDCTERRISHGSKWAAEMLYNAYESCLDNVSNLESSSSEKMDIAESLVVGPSNSSTSSSSSSSSTTTNTATAADSSQTKREIVAKKFAQSLLDNKEFERASKYASGFPNNPVLQFLRYYSLFLAGEKKKMDNTADVLDKQLQFENPYLNRLQNDLEELNSKSEGKMDAYLLYLFGLVLNEQNLLDQALKCFVESVNQAPHFWLSWLELSRLVKNKEQFQLLILPDHWMQNLFLGELYQRLQMLREALQIYGELTQLDVLKRSLYLKTETAVVHHNLQDPDMVVALFQEIINVDEYRMDHVDMYSNSLFVKGMTAELTALAHHCFEVDKYCTETSCVVGNYYSVRGEHDKAITYFQRAVKLNPKNSGAYTLMGHEFMEFKNTSAACLAYRKALQIEPKDFRAWYGLGQVYDILKMSTYAIYYYHMAHKVRPQDSRMIIALGDMYEKHQKYDEARRCFWKGHCVGDMDGIALLKLAKLYERLIEPDQAAASYSMYLKHLDEKGLNETEHLPNCYRFLADYYVSLNQLDEGYNYAKMCLEYESTKEEAKGILRRISQLRANNNNNNSTTSNNNNNNNNSVIPSTNHVIDTDAAAPS